MLLVHRVCYKPAIPADGSILSIPPAPLSWPTYRYHETQDPIGIYIPPYRQRTPPQSIPNNQSIPFHMFITVPLPPLLYLNTSPRRPRALDKLIRIRGLRVLADPDLPALLGGDMLDPDLLAVLLLELADEARVPELGGDAQVLATPQ